MIFFLLSFFTVGFFAKPVLGVKTASANIPQTNTTGITLNSILNLPQNSSSTVITVDMDTLARTIYGEDRNGGYTGMQAVANVVMNRVKANLNMFGKGVTGVCKKKGQFSCWNPETGYVTNSAIQANYNTMKKATKADGKFATALIIAERAIKGTLPDITRGATYYLTSAAYASHKASGKRTSSTWSYGQTPSFILGSHYFFTYNQVNYA
jgi:spore germination cell wall hydrolase CwlJ-like protein